MSQKDKHWWDKNLASCDLGIANWGYNEGFASSNSLGMALSIKLSTDPYPHSPKCYFLLASTVMPKYRQE